MMSTFLHCAIYPQLKLTLNELNGSCIFLFILIFTCLIFLPFLVVIYCLKSAWITCGALPSNLLWKWCEFHFLIQCFQKGKLIIIAFSLSDLNLKKQIFADPVNRHVLDLALCDLFLQYIPCWFVPSEQD